MNITRVYRGGDSAPADAELVRFRLYYDGELYSTRGKPVDGQVDRRAVHKHNIRKRFHRQLKLLWESHPVLQRWLNGEEERPGHSVAEELARQYTLNNFRWVPLIRHDIGLHCSLELLYLRQGSPFILSQGDLDNRSKTIIDALKMPKIGEIEPTAKPDVGEDPFFVLLDDDASVSQFKAEADALLEPTNPKLGDNDSRVLITVEVRRFRPTWGNMELL